MTRRSLFVAPAFAAILLAAPAGSAGEASSRFQTSVFAQRASGDAGRTDVSGMELQWAGRWKRLSWSAAVPWVRLEGDGTIVRVGGGWIHVPGSGSGNGRSGSGSGSGGSPASASVAAAGVSETSRFEASGLGDARLGAGLRLGRDRVAGIWSLHAGVKVPTADEGQGLGTGETDLWGGVTWLREGWHADVEVWAEWCALGDPPGYDLEDGPAGGLLVMWPVRRVELAAGVESASAVYLGAMARHSAVFLVRGPVGRRSMWEVEARAGLTEATPDLGLVVGIGF